MTTPNSHMQELLYDITESVQPLLGQARPAQYIPALASVDSKQFGMAVSCCNGDEFLAGDALVPFSIQSVSKVFTLTLALQIYGDDVWQRVGREPSGQAFNSLIQLELEHGVPRNPFINAGALVVADMIFGRLAAPKQRIKEFLWNLAGHQKIEFNRVVAKSEMEHSDRNAAAAHLMKSFGNFYNEVQPVLESYFHFCALEMTCVDLAKSFSFLANSGVSVTNGQAILTPRQSKQVNALLATCGLYDEAGEFAFKVGMPGKSGVGGGIVAVIPGLCSVCVWSPGLNESGNSQAGMEALSLFTTKLGKSIF